MQYQILASDYDNTLVPYGKSRPGPALSAAIRSMQRQGAKLVICTGRGYGSLISTKKAWGKLHYDYAICSNGAYVADYEGNVLYSDLLTSEEMYALVDFCEDYDYPIEFSFTDGYYAYVGYEDFRKTYGDGSDTGLYVYDGEDQDRHLTEMPAAAFAAMPQGAVERFAEKYGYLGINFICLGEGFRPGWYLYDINRGGLDKSTGLKGLCESLNIPLSAVAAAGDGNNDCGLLQAAGLGVAVDNATEAAKAAADRVIGHVEDEAVADLIAELWPAEAQQ